METVDRLGVKIVDIFGNCSPEWGGGGGGATFAMSVSGENPEGDCAVFRERVPAPTLELFRRGKFKPVFVFTRDRSVSSIHPFHPLPY